MYDRPAVWRTGIGRGDRWAIRPTWRKARRPLVLAILLLIVCVFTLAPIYWIALGALTPPDDLFTTPLHYLPRQLTLENLRFAARLVPLGRQFVNSTVLAGGSAAVSALICLPAAYAFARLRFPASGLLFVGILASGLVPNAATIIPLFELFERLSLIDTLPGLLILFVNLLLPASLWLLTVAVRQIPLELEEAAQLDGAGFWTVLLRIIVPALRPLLVTLFLINFITAWNEFFYPLIFSRTDATATLSLGVRQAAGSWSAEAALSLLVVLPVFTLAILCHKRITGGLMAGAFR